MVIKYFMPLKRLERLTTKGVLWLYILKLLETREMYAYEIRNELKKRFDFSPAVVTPYVVLYRLEKKGFVSAAWKEGRKYYKVTDEGEQLFDKGIAHLEEMLKKIKK